MLVAQSLHGTHPRQPKHRDFTLAAVLHPLENTWHANVLSDYEPEGREFDSLRARHIFKQLRRTRQLLNRPGVHQVSIRRRSRVHRVNYPALCLNELRRQMGVPVECDLGV
jgi:hypothetical protein